jgi:hypothetical protein
VLWGGLVRNQLLCIYLQAVEAHTIHSVTVPLQGGVLGGLRAHTCGVTIGLTDAVVSLEVTCRLVVAISATVKAFYPPSLQALLLLLRI